MSDYNWRPILPLSDAERRIDLAGIPLLYENWRIARNSLPPSGQVSIEVFGRQLLRRLSVETGILERLYTVDRGTTEALVAHGFAEELIARSSTDIEPSRLIDLLRDQEAAVQLAIDCIAGNRPLTKGLIHELQAIVTKHQETTTAVDQFGNRMEIALLKGKYKEQPNNPRRPEGSVHRYCPPIHVESEMDNLIDWLAEYGQDDPVLVSAWAHHRFTQIHPYQDGNGRVARVLTTVILLRADLLPIVVDRDLRVEYLNSLEAADFGDLSRLVIFFARLERNTILQAVSVDPVAVPESDRRLTSAVIKSVQEKFKKRSMRTTDLRNVDVVAIELREQARVALQNPFEEFEKTIGYSDPPGQFIEIGKSDRTNGYRYETEILNWAQRAGKFANPIENRYFIEASIRHEREELMFAVFFYHVGRELTGIMEATAFFRLRNFPSSISDRPLSESVAPCSTEPFVFTHRTDSLNAGDAFDRWLDLALAVAVKEFADRL